MLRIEPELQKNLKGKVVKGVVSVDAGGDEKFPGIAFTDGSLLTIQCDPEGNGPGFMVLEKGGKHLGCAG